MKTYYISIGPHCHPCGNLRSLKLRSSALPFDWLRTNSERGLEYVADLIETKFDNFTDDLVYNNKNVVVSKNYPYAEFFHHDLIKSSSNALDQKAEKGADLIETFHRRADRFMELINNKADMCYLLYCLSYSSYKKPNKLTQFIPTIDKFLKAMQNKGPYKLVIYITVDDPNFNLVLDERLTKYKNHPNVVITTCYRNIHAHKIYGDKKDFQMMLDKITHIKQVGGSQVNA